MQFLRYAPFKFVTKFATLHTQTVLSALFFLSGIIGEEHSALTDALNSMRLFNRFHGKPRELEQAKRMLVRVRPPPSFRKRVNYKYEGVCMAGFFKEKCTCNAPSLN